MMKSAGVKGAPCKAGVLASITVDPDSDVRTAITERRGHLSERSATIAISFVSNMYFFQIAMFRSEKQLVI